MSDAPPHVLPATYQGLIRRLDAIAKEMSDVRERVDDYMLSMHDDEEVADLLQYVCDELDKNFASFEAYGF
jgi:hypothetical protein